MTTDTETRESVNSAPAGQVTRLRRSRLGWAVVGGVAIVAAAVAGFSLLKTGDLPQDWSGKTAFCKTAQQFAIGNLGHSGANPVALLKALRQDAPTGLRSDVDELIAAASRPPGGGEDPAKEASQRVGRFIESRCGVNLPGIVT
jgi:hypothetical protein